MELDALVIGCGNIGSVITGLLVKGKHNVGILEASQMIPNLKIKEGGCEKIFDILNCSNAYFYSPASIEKIRLKKRAPIIVTAKTYSAGSVAEDLSRINAVNGLDSNQIILFQNGVNPEQRIKDSLLKNNLGKIVDNVFGAVLMMMAHPISNGIVEYKINKINLGCWDGNKKINEILSTVVHYFPFSFVDVSGTDSYKKSRLEKAALNSANSLCALFDATAGDLIENEITRIMLELKIKECAGISEACGYKLNDIMEKWDSASKMVYEHYPSMVYDFRRAIKYKEELKTEIDELDGAFVKLHRFGAAWPKYNDSCTEMIKKFMELFNTLHERDRLTGGNTAVETAKEFTDVNRLLVEMPRFEVNLPDKVEKDISRKFRYWEIREIKEGLGNGGDKCIEHIANDALFYMWGNLIRLEIEHKIY